jgi:DNA-binding response OmpR family regulator
MTSIFLISPMINFFSNIFKGKEIEPLREFTSEELEQLKLKTRIALVDDDEISHVKRLQKDGYNIVDFSDITEIDDFIRRKYHVVILDIQGIGKSLSETTEGWGILKYLKNECPHLVVLMFTGADWSVTKYKHLVDLADDFMGKDIEFLDFKSKLDAAIRKAFSPKFHFEIERKKLMKEIGTVETFDKIATIVNKYGRDRERTIKEIKKITTNDEVIKGVNNFLSIINSIFKLFQP